MKVATLGHQKRQAQGVNLLVDAGGTIVNGAPSIFHSGNPGNLVTGLRQKSLSSGPFQPRPDTAVANEPVLLPSSESNYQLFFALVADLGAYGISGRCRAGRAPALIFSAWIGGVAIAITALRARARTRDGRYAPLTPASPRREYTDCFRLMVLTPRLCSGDMALVS
jgi:hypothetical protein